MRARGPLSVLGLALVLLLLLPAAGAVADTASSGTLKINNPDVTEPDAANQPNPGVCGAAVVLTGFAPNLSGTLTVVGQGGGGNVAGPDSFSHPVSTDANGQRVISGINLRDGQYRASAFGKSKVFNIIECEQTDPGGDAEHCYDSKGELLLDSNGDPVLRDPVTGECPAAGDTYCRDSTGAVVPRNPDGTCPGGSNNNNDNSTGGGGGEDRTDVFPLIIERGVYRIFGPTRIETGVEVSKRLFEDGAASAVVLARSDRHPDALAGTPLSIEKDGPLLLTTPDSLHQATAAEIQRVLPQGGTVYLLGRQAALSDDVDAQVRQLGFQTVRLGGRDRFETATVIADEGLGNPDLVFVADGIKYPDALTAGAAAGFRGGAVILTADEQVPPETADYVAGLATDTTIVAVGGPAARAYPQAQHIVGATRYETAIKVAEEFYSEPTLVGIATGEQFADALTGGTLTARAGGPMLLSGKEALPASVDTYLDSVAETVHTAVLFGGTGALSMAVEDAVRARVIR